MVLRTMLSGLLIRDELPGVCGVRRPAKRGVAVRVVGCATVIADVNNYIYRIKHLSSDTAGNISATCVCTVQVVPLDMT